MNRIDKERTMRTRNFFYTFFICLLWCLQAQAQKPEFEEIIISCETQAKERVKTLIREKIVRNRWDPEYDAIRIEFTSDTLFIESVNYFLTEAERFTTSDMIQTAKYMEEKYDNLLNKYYRLVMERITLPEHKELFRNGQRTWLKYRDSEKQINSELITGKLYREGGTMWPVISAYRNMQLIKERVIYFYEILDCI